MNENVNTTCICNSACDKCIIKKTIENNIFTIFGNISKNNNIVLRYHGELIDSICYEKYENNLYIKYFFDDDKLNTKRQCLGKCTKCVGENYCTLIDLDTHKKITFSFCTKDNIDKEDLMSFNLTISEDLVSSIIDKYDDKPNENLPVVESKKELKIKNILQIIKDYFTLLKRKITSV